MARKQNVEVDDEDFEGPTPLEVMAEHDKKKNWTYRDHQLPEAERDPNDGESVASAPVIGRQAIAGAQKPKNQLQNA